MANTIAKNAQVTHQINWTGVRGNRLPIDSSSVWVTYSELQDELNNEHGTLYDGQFVGVTDNSTPYYITHNGNSYQAIELITSNTVDELNDETYVISKLSNYNTYETIVDEGIISRAMTYLYKYTEKLLEEIHNTHRKFIAHNENDFTVENNGEGANVNYTNADDVWVTYYGPNIRLNELLQRLGTGGGLGNVDQTKINVVNATQMWLEVKDNTLYLRSDVDGRGDTPTPDTPTPDTPTPDTPYIENYAILYSNQNITVDNYKSTDVSIIRYDSEPNISDQMIINSSTIYFAIPAYWITFVSGTTWSTKWNINAEYNTNVQQNDSAQHFGVVLTVLDDNGQTTEKIMAINSVNLSGNITLDGKGYYIFNYTNNIPNSTKWVYYKNYTAINADENTNNIPQET